MARPVNEHEDLKRPHKWTREHGYQPVEPEENEAAAEESPAGASQLGDDPAKVAEAEEFVRSKGYNQDAAAFIVRDQGVNNILQSKAAEVAEKAAAPVVEQHSTQVVEQSTSAEVDESEKEEEEDAGA